MQRGGAVCGCNTGQSGTPHLPEAVHRRQEAGDTGAGCEECTSGSEQYKQNS